MNVTKEIQLFGLKTTLTLAEVKYQKWQFYPENIKLCVDNNHDYESLLDELSAVIDSSDIKYDTEGWSYLIGLSDPIKKLQDPHFKGSCYKLLDYLSLEDAEDVIERLTHVNLTQKINLWYLCISLFKRDKSQYKKFWNEHHAWIKIQPWDMDVIDTSYFNYDFLMNIFIEPFIENKSLSHHLFVNLETCLDTEPEKYTELLGYYWNHPHPKLYDILQRKRHLSQAKEEKIMMALNIIPSDDSPEYRYYQTCHTLGARYEDLDPKVYNHETDLHI